MDGPSFRTLDKEKTVGVSARTSLQTIKIAMLLITFVSNLGHFAPLHAQIEPGAGFIGLGLGFGFFGADLDVRDREMEPSGHLRLGAVLNDRVLLGLESTGWRKTVTEGDISATATFLTLSAVASYYPEGLSGFFVKGGVGRARLQAAISTSESTGSGYEVGNAVTLGLGQDAFGSGPLAFSPFANLVVASREGGGVSSLFQVGLGFIFMNRSP